MSNRIVTRGLGTNQLLATRGYGRIPAVIIEAAPIIVGKRRIGGPGKRRKIALDEEQCFKINVVLEAINSNSIDDIEGCVERCYNEKDKLSVKIKNLDSKMISKEAPDPVKVEALLLWIKRKR